MMLLCVFFILLPATALAECPRNVLTVLFGVLDFNNDTQVEFGECAKLFTAFDVNQDQNITVEEAQQVAPFIAPPFVGYESDLIKFLDIDKSGNVTFTDILLEYYKADKNKDGYKSKFEYDRYVDEYCKKNYSQLGDIFCRFKGCGKRKED